MAGGVRVPAGEVRVPAGGNRNGGIKTSTPPRNFLKKRLAAKKTGFMGINLKSGFLFRGVVIVWEQ